MTDEKWFLMKRLVRLGWVLTVGFQKKCFKSCLCDSGNSRLCFLEWIDGWMLVRFCDCQQRQSQSSRTKMAVNHSLGRQQRKKRGMQTQERVAQFIITQSVLYGTIHSSCRSEKRVLSRITWSLKNLARRRHDSCFRGGMTWNDAKLCWLARYD